MSSIKDYLIDQKIYRLSYLENFFERNNKYPKEVILELVLYAKSNKMTFLRQFDSINKIHEEILPIHRLIEILHNLHDRIDRLKINKCSTTKIDLSYYECFFEDKEEALFHYKKYNTLKTSAGRKAIAKIPNIRTLEYSIKRLGLEEGTKHHNKVTANRKINASTNIDYWIKQGLTEEEAKLALKERQTTFSLEKCIKKHGIDKGTKIFQERQDNWQNTLKSKSNEEIQEINSKKAVTLKNMIRKWGPELGLLKYESWYSSTGRTLENFQKSYGIDKGLAKYNEFREIFVKTHKSPVSKESIKFFVKLYKWLRKNSYCTRSDIYWGINGSKEYWLKSEEGFKFYDFTIKSLKIILEYNGTAFHAKLGNENWRGAFGTPYIDSIKNDEFKLRLAKSQGFKLFYIWSDENLENKLDEIKELVIESLKVQV